MSFTTERYSVFRIAHISFIIIKSIVFANDDEEEKKYIKWVDYNVPLELMEKTAREIFDILNSTILAILFPPYNILLYHNYLYYINRFIYFYWIIYNNLINLILCNIIFSSKIS